MKDTEKAAAMNEKADRLIAESNEKAERVFGEVLNSLKKA